LAAIDGMTRVGSRRRQAYARYCGVLFSLGHGLVVISIACLAGLAGAQWALPAWFEPLGSAISIGFLTLVGWVNLRAVMRAPTGQPVALVGVRGVLLGRLLGTASQASGALAVAGVGALFALSFDTLSQSAVFALMATRFGGLGHALTLGLLFVLGMLVSDGINGWWISRLIDRTDRWAVLASRTMTSAVAVVSLLVAAIGLGRMTSDWIDGWFSGKELFVGLSVIALIGLTYLWAHRTNQGQTIPPIQP
jgi:high-affinity nickel-transport protein